MGYFALELFSNKRHLVRSYGYSYRNGPRVWDRNYPECSGTRQSPVNVDSTCVSRTQSEMKTPFTWCGYDSIPNHYTLLNDGRKVALTAKWNAPENIPTLMGGPLGNERYRFVGLHFRWGPCDDWGSEHTLDYKSYPLELQVLHTRQDFPSPRAAISSGACGSIVIVSYFFKISPKDNLYLHPVVLNLSGLKRPGSTVQLPKFPLDWLVSPFHSGYYSYAGSLSEPPCSQVVVWILKFEPSLCISSRQLAQFRGLLSADGPNIRNSRPVQLLHGRRVFFYEN